MEKKTRIALVGAGLVGKRHIAAINELSNIELAGVVDTDISAKKIADQNHCNWYESVDEMLTEERINGAVLSTPTTLHAKQAQLCVQRDIPVLIEKPITASTAEGKELVNTASARDVPILVGHHRRHNSIVQEAKKLINSRSLGSIQAAHFNCWFYKPDEYFDRAEWRKQDGAGPLSVNLIHDIDLARYLCGEIVCVQAYTKKSLRGFENEEVAAAVLKFENGALGSVSVSDRIVSPWSWELTSKEHPVYPSTDQTCYLIGGDKGSLSIPDVKLWYQTGTPDWWQPIKFKHPSIERVNPLVRQMEHFARVCSGEIKPLVSGMDGLKSLAVIEAIAAAAREKSEVIVGNFI